MKLNRKKVLIIAAVVVLLFVAIIGLVKVLKTYRNLTGLLENSSVKMDSATAAINSVIPRANLPHYDFDYSWLDSNVLCMHAMGGINNLTYTNSLEAFEENYSKGARVFEVDFQITTDNRIVAAHDETIWREQISTEDIEFSSANFAEQKIYGLYTTLNVCDVMELMQKYKDIYIITDTKELSNEDVYYQFSSFVKEAEKTDASVLDRIIPQIYNEDMLYRIMDVYDWKSVVFTLYQTDFTTQTLQAFVLNSGVGCITMWDNLASADMIASLDAVGARVAVHTVNDEAYAKLLLSSGVDLIYTDFLEPDVFNKA